MARNPRQRRLLPLHPSRRRKPSATTVVAVRVRAAMKAVGKVATNHAAMAVVHEAAAAAVAVAGANAPARDNASASMPRAGP